MGHVVAHRIVETRGRLSLTRLVVIIIILKKKIILKMIFEFNGLDVHQSASRFFTFQTFSVHNYMDMWNKSMS